MQAIVQCEYEENMTVPAVSNMDRQDRHFAAHLPPQKALTSDNFVQLRRTHDKKRAPGKTTRRKKNPNRITGRGFFE
ncbi:hypothetical protein [Janthinobacterium sp. 13]|uniref:hypothetical protein n=1 Tax=Janthinobacterium sp. 13 TaxID=2035211 RepID=UPI00117BAD2E|nr:hypothetical protein [Janthinobacterium sp. 13]